MDQEDPPVAEEEEEGGAVAVHPTIVARAPAPAASARIKTGFIPRPWTTAIVL